MNLAIKGHETRGAEVINLLEMLGGINVGNLYGDVTCAHYFINNNYIDVGYVSEPNSKQYLLYSLEEFEKKFSYKVGDKVLINDDENDVYTITSMKWNGSRVVYKIKAFDGIDDVHEWFADEMNPYKEETMEEKIQAYEVTEEICANEIAIEFNPSKFEMIERNGKYFIVKKQPQYPKTYKECCEVLMGKTNFQDFGLVLTKISTTLHEEDSVSPEPPHITLINNFYKLLICRDAYWRMAGEQMGLGKPWKPDYTNDDVKFCICCCANLVVDGITYETNQVLTFPTEEIRAAFFDNFKDLIEECKELL